MGRMHVGARRRRYLACVTTDPTTQVWARGQGKPAPEGGCEATVRILEVGEVHDQTGTLEVRDRDPRLLLKRDKLLKR